MSLAEIMVALGLVGATAMGAAALMGNMGNTSKEAEAVIEKTQFASAIGVYLNTPMGCDDLKTQGAFSTTEKDITLPTWRFAGVKVFDPINVSRFIQIKGDEKPKIFQISSLTAKLDTTSASTVKQSDAVTGKVIDLTKSILRVRANLRMKARDYIHVYDVTVLTAADMTIKYCSGDRTLAETCTALKGKVDPVTKRCIIDESCRAFGSFVSLSCSPRLAGAQPCDVSRGVGTINPVTGNMGCPAGTSAVSTGADIWNVSVKCGKKCKTEQNNTIGFYTCLQCD